MTDIASRLESIRDGLTELQQQLDGSEQASAVDRLRALIDELDGVIRQAGTPMAPSAPKRTKRGKQPDVEKCPRCAIRSLNMVAGKTRLVEDGPGDAEVLWHCSSCGYEIWRLDD
jgi:hypothetical protein